MERIEFVRLAASRARLAFERISADSDMCARTAASGSAGAQVTVMVMVRVLATALLLPAQCSRTTLASHQPCP